LASGTLDVPLLTFGDAGPQRRQVLHPAAFAQNHWLMRSRHLAAVAACRALHDDCVGYAHQLQRLAAVAELSSGLLPAAPAQAPWLRRQSVAGRWCRRVVAVSGQLRLHLQHTYQHTYQQRGDLLLLLLEQGLVGDPYRWRHASMLRRVCTAA
jgi:hypothetical protein